MRITYSDGWVETFLRCTHIECDGTSMFIFDFNEPGRFIMCKLTINLKDVRMIEAI